MYPQLPTLNSQPAAASSGPATKMKLAKLMGHERQHLQVSKGWGRDPIHPGVYVLEPPILVRQNILGHLAGAGLRFPLHVTVTVKLGYRAGNREARCRS